MRSTTERFMSKETSFGESEILASKEKKFINTTDKKMTSTDEKHSYITSWSRVTREKILERVKKRTVLELKIRSGMRMMNSDQPLKPHDDPIGQTLEDAESDAKHDWSLVKT